MKIVSSQSGRPTRASSKTCFTFPNEDWTKVSDNVERRRMQNRIAQRKYRQNIKRRLAELDRQASISSHNVTQLHAQVKQVDCRAKTNQHTDAPLTNKTRGSWSRQLFSSQADIPKQFPSPMLSGDDCPSSPDGFYEKESPTNLWLPFIPPDQYMFRPYLECQSSPVTSGTHISTIYHPAVSTFAEGTWRDLLNHCDNSTSDFLVNSGVSNKI
ncbi:hypothetical protein B0J14DRAFT_641920 [Halenospora varia]|nr:hypothetical protein B0J14DRAFT_641920 [Halenospora varia]